MLKEIAMLSNKKKVKKDAWLFMQDDPALWLYIILEGAMSLSLIVQRNGHGEHIERLGLLGRGEILGWSSIVKPYLYSLGALAEQDTELIEIKAGGFRELLEDNPYFGYNFMKNIAEVVSERLKFKCIQLLSMHVENPVKHKEHIG
jgi:CRP-like cAMP-binding protein